tara:strand:- start:2680 stop:2856 length:177 start_codon:yes stop_codon:yes gene_type:complete
MSATASRRKRAAAAVAEPVCVERSCLAFSSRGASIEARSRAIVVDSCVFTSERRERDD